MCGAEPGLLPLAREAAVFCLDGWWGWETWWAANPNWSLASTVKIGSYGLIGGRWGLPFGNQNLGFWFATGQLLSWAVSSSPCLIVTVKNACKWTPLLMDAFIYSR